MFAILSSLLRSRLRGIRCVAPALALLGLSACDKSETKKAAPTMVSISLPPLPPPPPPPPPKPEEPEPEKAEQKQEMIEQEPTVAEEPPPQAPADEPEALGTNITGDGPGNDFGLKPGGGGGGGNGSGGKIGGKGGSRFGYYAGQVQNTVASALRSNSKTRTATFNGKISIWADATGRITRVKLAGTTGDVAVDQAIRNDVLSNLQLQSAPPSDMPMPIHMRISGRKPN